MEKLNVYFLSSMFWYGLGYIMCEDEVHGVILKVDRLEKLVHFYRQT